MHKRLYLLLLMANGCLPFSRQAPEQKSQIEIAGIFAFGVQPAGWHWLIDVLQSTFGYC